MTRTEKQYINSTRVATTAKCFCVVVFFVVCLFFTDDTIIYTDVDLFDYLFKNDILCFKERKNID